MEEKTQQEIKKLKNIIKDRSKRVNFLEAVNRNCIYICDYKQIITGVFNAN